MQTVPKGAVFSDTILIMKRRIGRKNFVLSIIPVALIVALIGSVFSHEINAAGVLLLMFIPPFAFFADGPIDISVFPIAVFLIEVLMSTLLVSLTVRRLHDFGWSGAVYFFALAMPIMLMPLVVMVFPLNDNFIQMIFFYVLLCSFIAPLLLIRGSAGDNKYGPPDTEDSFWKTILPFKRPDAAYVVPHQN